MANPFDQFDTAVEENPFDRFDVDPAREEQKASLRTQQQSIAAETPSLPSKVAAKAASGLEKGMTMPERVIRGGLDALGYYKALDAVTGGGTKFQDYNRGWLESFNQRDQQLTKEDEALGAKGFGYDVVEGVARATTELPVQLLGGGAGATVGRPVAGMALTAGGTSGLSQYAQDRGEGRGQLESAIYGAVSGTITGLTTAAFGQTGVESVFKKEGVKGVANKILSVLKEAGLEGAEEAVDQFQQDLLERVARNPDKPIEQSVRDVLLAGSVGSLIGGAARGVSTLAPSQAEVSPTTAAPVIDPAQDRAPEITLPLLTPEEIQREAAPLPTEATDAGLREILPAAPESADIRMLAQPTARRLTPEQAESGLRETLPLDPTTDIRKAPTPIEIAPDVIETPLNLNEPMYYGDVAGKASGFVPKSKFGDYGSASYITPKKEFAESFASGLAFSSKLKGSGIVHSVKPPKLEKTFTADSTPLTKEEIKFWEQEGEMMDGIVTRRDLTDNYGGRSVVQEDLRGISESWDAFLDKFGYDSVWDGEQLAIRKGQVEIQPTPSLTRVGEKEQGGGVKSETPTLDALERREKAEKDFMLGKIGELEMRQAMADNLARIDEALKLRQEYIKRYGEPTPPAPLKAKEATDLQPANEGVKKGEKLNWSKTESQGAQLGFGNRQEFAETPSGTYKIHALAGNQRGKFAVNFVGKDGSKKHVGVFRNITEARKSAEADLQPPPKIEGMGGARVKLAGSPQTYTVIETLQQTDVEKSNGEQPVRIKNERTGKEEVVLQSEITEVKTPTKGAKPRRTKADLNKALKDAGLDPSVFPDAKSKKNALERAIAKIEETQKKLRGSRSTLSMGVPKAALDLILEAARLSLKAGNGIAKALEAAMAKARELLGNNFNEDELRTQITDELTKTERKETESKFWTGQQESGSRSKQLIEAEQFLEGKTPEEASKQLVLFATTKEGIGLSAENFQAANALLMQRLFEKLQTTKNPVEKAEFSKLIERSAGLMQQQSTEAGRQLESAKVTDDLIPGIKTWLLWRGLAKAAWARAVELKDGVTVEDVKVVEGSSRQASTEVAASPEDIKVEKKLMEEIRKAGINLSTLFLDNDQATQKQRREHLFKEIRKAFPNLTTDEQLKLEKAMMEAWEKARLKIFRQQFGKFVGMPEVAQENVIKEIQPELIRQANLGTLDDEAFRAAVASKLGLPEIDGKTAQDITKLAQEAQAAPKGVIRNKILQKMVDAIQSAGQFDQWQILTDSWFASVLSGTRTMAAVLSGSFLQSGVQAMEQTVDAAIAKANPKVGAQIMFTYLSGLVEGIMNAYDVIVTGDVTRRAEFADNINAVLNGKGRMDSLEGMKKFGNRWQKFLAQQAYVRRIIVGFDYVGAIAARDSGILYNAMLTSPEKLEIAQRRFDKKLSQQALVQARAELGPGAKRVDVLARKLEILNQGIGHEIEQRAKILGEIAALNAPPIGWSAVAYGMIDKLAKVIQGKGETISEGQSKALALGAKAVAGLAFARAGLNMLGNAVTFVPILGGINVARAYAGAKVLPGQKIWKGLLIYDENGQPVSEDRRRLMLANQLIGTTLAIALYAKAAADQDDEDGFELYGSLKEYTPAERKILSGMGIQPYTFTLNKKTGRKYSWKDFSFGGAFAVPAEMRDKERRSGELTDFTKTSQVFVTMAGSGAMGLSYVRDLSMIRGFSQAMGISSFSREEDLEGWNRLVAGFARPAAGLVPFSSLMREAETWEIIGGDAQTYRPTAPIDYWLASLPVARRMVGEGPEYNVAGLPVRKQLDAGSRFVIPAVEDPLLQSLSQLVVRGIMPKFPYDNGYIKGGEKFTAKEMPKLKYRYEVESLKAWREIMLPRAAEISKMTKAEYDEFYEKELQPESKRIHDEIQLELDPEALTFKGGKWVKNPYYPMKGE